MDISTNLSRDRLEHRLDMQIEVLSRVMMDLVAVPGIQSDLGDIRGFQIIKAVLVLNKVSG